MAKIMDVKGQPVMITGASSGIGLAFAHEFARRGADLVLVARSGQVLEALCLQLRETYAINAIAIVADLSIIGASAAVYAQACAQGLTPTILVNNAGFATYGRFEQLALDRQQGEILLNCMAVVEMTHHALPAMIKKQHGAIINVASTAGLQPDPYMAIYGATKAFVLSFSEALWAENLDQGVRVLALCPGSTETAFFDVVNAAEASVGKRMTAEAVVAIAFKALANNQNYVIAGFMNWLLGQLHRLLPRWLTLKIARKILTPRADNPSIAS
jgi:short-subunit dehydrogenase